MYENFLNYQYSDELAALEEWYKEPVEEVVREINSYKTYKKRIEKSKNRRNLIDFVEESEN